jgi:hypothetical protein
LEDFDKIEDDDTPIHSLLKGADIFEPTDPELELTIKTTFAGMPDFIISKKQLQRVVAWLGVAEISPEGETESQQLFCKLPVELIKLVSTPTIEETIELLKNEQISKQSTTITEILPRLQELFMNDDRESWMKIYAMLSVTIPKLDIIQQVSFNYYTTTMILTLHSILSLMRLRPWDSSSAQIRTFVQPKF